MYDILCVTNRHLCAEPFYERIEKIARAHPAGILLREKDLSPEQYRVLAIQAMKICKNYHTACILHSFSDVAEDLSAAAFHGPLPILRSMTPGQRKKFSVLGASCHSVEDALAAQSFGCTYITAGHIFETDCKKGLEGRGLEFLKTICTSVSIPVYAIGGISSGNIALVRQAGAAGACVMSGIMRCGDPAAYVNHLRKRENVDGI